MVDVNVVNFLCQFLTSISCSCARMRAADTAGGMAGGAVGMPLMPHPLVCMIPDNMDLGAAPITQCLY
jgi:hypothetical protein